MINKFLPSCFLGLSIAEIRSLEKLPWKKGVLSDLKDSGFVFLITKGRVWNQSNRYYSIKESLLGIKPFVKQKKEKYSGDDYHQIIYLPTNKLAEYFLENPSAMKSYLLSLKNIGYEVISQYDFQSSKWLVYSEISMLETVHFALSLCVFNSQVKKQKSILLEFNSNGVNIFQLLGIQVPRSILQTEDSLNEELTLTDIIKKTKVSYNKLQNKRNKEIEADIDFLNINYLSLYKANREQWSTLFFELEKEYENIIIHLSDDKNVELFENVDIMFVFEHSIEPLFEGFFPDKNKNEVLWPLLKRVSVRSTLDSYPIVLEDNQNIEEVLPDNLANDSLFWTWFNERFLFLAKNKTAIVLLENQLNYLKTLRLLENSKDLLGQYHLLFQGVSSFAIAIYSFSKDASKISKKSNKDSFKLIDSKEQYVSSLSLENKNIFQVSSFLEAVYPKHGFFSSKKLVKKLSKVIDNFLFEKVAFSILAQHSKSKNHFLVTTDLMIDALVKYAFHSLFWSEESNDRKYFSSSEINLQYFFRIGFQEVIFIFLENQKENLEPAESLNDICFDSMKKVSGRLVKKINIEDNDFDFTIESIL